MNPKTVFLLAVILAVIGFALQYKSEGQVELKTAQTNINYFAQTWDLEFIKARSSPTFRKTIEANEAQFTMITKIYSALGKSLGPATCGSFDAGAAAEENISLVGYECKADCENGEFIMRMVLERGEQLGEGWLIRQMELNSPQISPTGRGKSQ